MKKESAINEIKKEFEGGLKNVKSALCPSNRDQYLNHYLNTYCSLLKNNQSLCKQAKVDPDFRNHAIVAVANMAYGWMPVTLTMCNINQEIKHKYKKTILDAFDVKTPGDARNFAEGFASSPINDSCVGLSKSLHFINPEFFPIWDSNVAETFGMHHHCQIKEIQVYGCYIEFCHSALDCQTVAEAVKQVQNLICCHAGDEVEKFRALEFMLFVIGKEQKKRNRLHLINWNFFLPFKCD